MTQSNRSVLDLSHNRISDPRLVEIVAELPKLAVFNCMENQIRTSIQDYRKTLISTCLELKYLDDRPVFDVERRTTMAWAKGGSDGERVEREIIREEERRKRDMNLNGK